MGWVDVPEDQPSTKTKGRWEDIPEPPAPRWSERVTGGISSAAGLGGDLLRTAAEFYGAPLNLQKGLETAGGVALGTLSAPGIAAGEALRPVGEMIGRHLPNPGLAAGPDILDLTQTQPLGPPSPAGREAAAQALGEGAATVGSLAGPQAFMRSGSYLFRKLLTGLPGAGSAQHLLAKGILDEVPQLVKPAGSPAAKELFDLLETQAGQAMPTALPRTAAAAEKILTERTPSPVPASIERTLTQNSRKLLKSITDSPDQAVGLDQLRATVRSLGQHITDAEGTDVQSAYKFLYRNMWDDLRAEVARTNNPALKVYETAMAESYKEHVAHDLADLLNRRSVISAPRADGSVAVNPHAALELLDRNAELVKDLQRIGAYTEVKAGIQDALRYTGSAKPAAAGTLQRVATGTALASVGYAGAREAGADTRTAVIVGALSPLASYGFARALMTRPGRTLLQRSMENTGGYLDMRLLSVAGLAGHAQYERAFVPSTATMETGPTEPPPRSLEEQPHDAETFSRPHRR